jgi:hypothetical protein
MFERKPLMEKPVIFNAEMVRAILGGRKNMTRRIIKPQPASGIVFLNELMKQSPYKVGMKLWVRETFVTGTHIGHAPWVRYRATDEKDVPEGTKWKPSIFMPRKLSRINLEIIDIRVERLQDITKTDAIAEGIGQRIGSSSMGHTFTASEHFHALWDSINKKRGYGWAENPWVFVISFKRIT